MIFNLLKITKNDKTVNSFGSLFLEFCEQLPFFISFSDALSTFLTLCEKTNQRSLLCLGVLEFFCGFQVFCWNEHWENYLI